MSTQCMTAPKSSAVKDQFYRIKLCPFFLDGTCKKGKKCTFAHREEDLRVGVSLRKTRICDMWKQGECRNKACKFAHGEQELKSTPDYYKTAVCKYWLRGCCPQGDSCRHAHGEHELRSRSKKTDTTNVPEVRVNSGRVSPAKYLAPHRNATVPAAVSLSDTLTSEYLRTHNSPHKSGMAEFYDGRSGKYVLLPTKKEGTESSDLDKVKLDFSQSEKRFTSLCSQATTVPTSPAGSRGFDSLQSLRMSSYLPSDLPIDLGVESWGFLPQAPLGTSLISSPRGLQSTFSTHRTDYFSVQSSGFSNSWLGCHDQDTSATDSTASFDCITPPMETCDVAPKIVSSQCSEVDQLLDSVVQLTQRVSASGNDEMSAMALQLAALMVDVLAQQAANS